MIRKMISILLIWAFTAPATAQDGWTHDLIRPFPEPLHFLELPWAEPAEPADMHVCWQDEPVPFLGSEHRFYCYELTGVTAREAAQHLRVAFSDARLGSYYMRDRDLNGSGTMTTLTPSFILGDAVSAWVFNRPAEPTRVSFSFRPEGGWTGAAPGGPSEYPSTRLLDLVPAVEPDPEP